MLYVQSPGTVSIHPGLSLTKGTNPGTKSNNWLVFVQNSLNLHLVVVVSSICSCGSGWPGPLCVCHKNRRLVKILPEAVGGWCWWTGWLVQVTLVWLAAALHCCYPTYIYSSGIPTTTHSFQPFSTYFSSYTSTNFFFYSTFVGWKFSSFSRLLSSIKPGLKSAVFSLQVIWSIIIVTNLCWPFVSLHPRSMSTIPLLELDLACQGWRRR